MLSSQISVLSLLFGSRFVIRIHSVSGIMNDTLRYDLTAKTWTPMAAQAPSGESPASVGRYFHAAVCVPRENTIYLFGGMALKGENLECKVGWA